MNIASAVHPIKEKTCYRICYNKEEMPDTLIMRGLCVTEFKQD